MGLGARLARVPLPRALAHRSFALVWGGQTVSRFGDSLHTIAIAWWVIEETGSAAALGLVLACATVPQLVFLLLGGVLVDRFSRLGVMLVADVVRAVAAGAVALLAWHGDLAVWHLCALGAVFGTVSAAFFPAYLAAVPDLLPDDALPSANSLRFVGSRAANIAGPALGAALIAAGGIPLAFALDALSFAVAAVAVAMVGRDPALHRRAAGEGSVLHDLRAGIGTVAGSPWLWVAIAIAGVSNLTLEGPLAAVLPALVRETRGEGVRTLALLNGLSATGALAAAIWIGRRSRVRRRGPVLYGAWIAAGLALAVVGLPLPLVAIGLAMLLLGVGETTLNLIWAQTLQEFVPRERLGRVLSIDALGSLSLAPVGYALAGLAADAVGPARVLVGGGLLSAAIVGCGLLHPAVRGVD